MGPSPFQWRFDGLGLKHLMCNVSTHASYAEEKSTKTFRRINESLLFRS